VEPLLNLIWLVVSLLLASWWIRAIRTGRARRGWGALVTLCLLLVLLFPVISMTDDLVAMTSPSEMEHMVRRVEMSQANLVVVEPFAAVTLAALLFAVMAWMSAQMMRLRPSPLSVKLLSGFFRTAGVRPPPISV
jgi:hypothetical protein